MNRPSPRRNRRARQLGVGVVTAALATAGALTYTQAHADSEGVSGFFADAESTDADNRQQLEAMQEAGGDTVITFGYTLTQIEADDARSGRFADCQLDDAACFDDVSDGVEVRKVLEYTGNTEFTSDQELCARDIFTSGGDYDYGVFAVPVDGTCSDASSFDIVMTAHSGFDKAASVTQEAGALGMDHYIGMPAPDRDADEAWLPDTSYLSTLKDFTGRFAAATGNPDGLGGFYQHREMPMSDFSDWDGMYSVYGLQNDAVAEKSANKTVLISPYIDARKEMDQTVDKAKAAVGKMADTKGDLDELIIAPQDGMGTGKGTAYSGDKWDWRVDPYQRTVVGDVTNAEAYFASSAGYYSAMNDGIAGRSGVSLWANLEGMAPVVASGEHANPCSTGHSDDRGFTLDSRMTEQLQDVAGHTSKNISYHWNYYTCSREGGPPLQDVIGSLG